MAFVIHRAMGGKVKEHDILHLPSDKPKEPPPKIVMDKVMYEKIKKIYGFNG